MTDEIPELYSRAESIVTTSGGPGDFKNLRHLKPGDELLELGLADQIAFCIQTGDDPTSLTLASEGAMFNQLSPNLQIAVGGINRLLASRRGARIRAVGSLSYNLLSTILPIGIATNYLTLEEAEIDKNLAASIPEHARTGRDSVGPLISSIVNRIRSQTPPDPDLITEYLSAGIFGLLRSIPPDGELGLSLGSIIKIPEKHRAKSDLLIAVHSPTTTSFLDVECLHPDTKEEEAQMRDFTVELTELMREKGRDYEDCVFRISCLKPITDRTIQVDILKQARDMGIGSEIHGDSLEWVLTVERQDVPEKKPPIGALRAIVTFGNVPTERHLQTVIRKIRREQTSGITNIPPIIAVNLDRMEVPMGTYIQALGEALSTRAIQSPYSGILAYRFRPAIRDGGIVDIILERSFIYNRKIADVYPEIQYVASLIERVDERNLHIS